MGFSATEAPRSSDRPGHSTAEGRLRRRRRERRSGCSWARSARCFVACANIANSMLVRADARRHEFAVRAALGAAPARIARELLVESLVMAQPAERSGWCLHTLAWRRSSRSVRATCRGSRIAVHPPVLGFTLVVSLASTLLFGSITALKQHCTSTRRAIGPRAARARAASGTRRARSRRRAGGARTRVGRERGPHDSNVSAPARRRPRFLGPGDDSDGSESWIPDRATSTSLRPRHWTARGARSSTGSRRFRASPHGGFATTSDGFVRAHRHRGSLRSKADR